MARRPRTAPGGLEKASALLDDGPVDRPRGWRRLVQEVWSEAEWAALQRSLRRGQPFGSPAWTTQTARKLGLESTLRAVGRPKRKDKR